MPAKPSDSAATSASLISVDTHLLDQLEDAVLVLTEEGIVEHANRAAQTLLAMGKRTHGTALNGYFAPPDNLRSLWQDWVAHNPVKSLQVLTLCSGRQFAAQISVIQRIQGPNRYYLAVMHPVSARVDAKHKRSNTNDGLTGLLNRAGLELCVNDVFGAGLELRLSNQLALYIDIDQFKVINTAGGIDAGDALLKHVAHLLRQEVRNTDVVARVGNDEFVILLRNCPLEVGRTIAQHLRDSVSKTTFHWKTVDYQPNLSIGMTIVRPHATFLQIMSEAEAACSVAKAKVRDRIHLFSPGDSVITRHATDFKWIQAIKHALESNQFRLFVQKILPLTEDSPICEYGEILVRMVDETGDFIPPMDFIPVAERYGLMHEIDRWVVRNTFKMVREHFLDKGLPAGRYSINLSGPSVSDEQTLPYIEKMLVEYAVDPTLFCFEITETAAIENITHAKALITGLKELGCEFSLDDFGSGMSSFGYLKHLAVDYLKIDGLFVKDMMKNPVDLKLVHAIHQLGRVMGIKTVAEFVENDAILEKLKELGVDYAQGYAIDRPQPIH